jgi:hypothetical protein
MESERPRIDSDEWTPGLSSEIPGAGADAGGAVAPRVGGDRVSIRAANWLSVAHTEQVRFLASELEFDVVRGNHLLTADRWKFGTISTR